MRLDEITSALGQLEAAPHDAGLAAHAKNLLDSFSDVVMLRTLAERHVGDLASGRLLNERILSLDPIDDTAMARLASLHAQFLEPEPARRWARAALAKNPLNLLAYHALLATYFLPAEARDVESVARELLREAPHDYQAYVSLALGLYAQHRPEEAIATVEEALSTELPADQLMRLSTLRAAMERHESFDDIQRS